jgi:hypothetical protein
MADEIKVETTDAKAAENTRREFVKKSAQVAVTAPAVAMLLSATTKPASAVSLYQASQSHILDDFTSGNDHEDIDSLRLHSNTIGGQPAKDDTFTG